MDQEQISRINKEAWNEVSDIHKSYHFDKLLENFSKPGFSCVQGMKLEYLQNHGFRGKSIVQPCCNNGRDLLSMKNLGAERCFGFDLSDEFINQGQKLAVAGGIDCELVACDVYQLGHEYDGQFDIAYITAGSLAGLPDLNRFFAVVSRLLKPGGWLFMQEVHPIVDMLSMEPSKRPRFLRFKISYFFEGSFLVKNGLDYYRSRSYKSKPYYRFHHKLSSIIQAMIDNNLQIETMNELPIDASGGRFKRIKRKRVKLPLSYALTAKRQG